MRTLEENLKLVLCDKAAKCGSIDKAFDELIGTFEANAHKVYEQGEELANKLKEEGEPESYINLRLEAFAIQYDREMHCLHTTRKIRADGYRG